MQDAAYARVATPAEAILSKVISPKRYQRHIGPSNSLTAAVLVFVWLFLFQTSAAGSYQTDCRTFSETKKSLCGRFLDYWEQNGGLTQQGLPLTEEFIDRSLDGKGTYRMQYFERSTFEYHPENQPPHDVLLSLMGTEEYNSRYGSQGAPGQQASTENPRIFTETGKTLGGRFRVYWEQNGGLAQQGYPISEELEEVSLLNGKKYRVQYFQRAVFEYHPENTPPYDVLLAQLGTFRFKNVLATCDRHQKLRGTTIAEGRNTQPTPLYGLRSYRVEEVALPATLTCVVEVPAIGATPSGNPLEAQAKTFDKFWRVSVVGDRVGAPTSEGWYIWLDAQLLGYSPAGKS